MKKIIQEISNLLRDLTYLQSSSKRTGTFFYQFFCENFNDVIQTGNFSEQLKWVDVKPISKKYSGTDKENCTPVSIVPNISKIYERCLFSKLSNNFKLKGGFRKVFSVVNYLLPMIEK